MVNKAINTKILLFSIARPEFHIFQIGNRINDFFFKAIYIVFFFMKSPFRR